jgi:mono/diheme cytochrome c family protein
MRRGLLLLVVAVAAGVAGADDDDLGARVYRERCAMCHGTDGRGDGPIGAALVPPPKNLRDAAFWRNREDAELRAVVVDGRPGTLMQAFGGVLPDEEIAAVVAHLKRFRPKEALGDALGRDGEASGGRAGEDAPGGTDRP